MLWESHGKGACDRKSYVLLLDSLTQSLDCKSPPRASSGKEEGQGFIPQSDKKTEE